MNLSKMTDDELREASKEKIKSGPRKGCHTAEAERAAYMLRERENMFCHVTFWDGNNHCIES